MSILHYFYKRNSKKHEIQIGFISMLLLNGFFFILKEILIKYMYNEYLLVKCFKQKTKNKIIPQKFIQIRHIYLHNFLKKDNLNSITNLFMKLMLKI